MREKVPQASSQGWVLTLKMCATATACQLLAKLPGVFHGVSRGMVVIPGSSICAKVHTTLVHKAGVQENTSSIAKTSTVSC
jgi:hypothetical protein